MFEKKRFRFWAGLYALGFKVGKKYYYDPKNIFLQQPFDKSVRILCWFQICWKIF